MDEISDLLINLLHEWYDKKFIKVEDTLFGSFKDTLNLLQSADQVFKT